VSNVRKHLVKYHIEQWVHACQNLKIPIQGTDAKLAIQRFKNLPEPTDLEAGRPQYSKDAFVNALAEFVVGDDQVCIF
jgi:hypothetical protein